MASRMEGKIFFTCGIVTYLPHKTVSSVADDLDDARLVADLLHKINPFH